MLYKANCVVLILASRYAVGIACISHPGVAHKINDNNSEVFLTLIHIYKPYKLATILCIIILLGKDTSV